jgi:hypothetical protein
MGACFTLIRVSPVAAGLAMATVIVLGTLGPIWLSVAKGRRIPEPLDKERQRG